MDYTKRLFSYFSQNEGLSHIIVAPGAPPIERSANGIGVALEAVLDGNDVQDTLVGLRRYGETGGLPGGLTKYDAIPPMRVSDTFCLSIQGAGRFRVTYLTQRGSKAFSMRRIPFTIPSCQDLNLDASTVDRVLRALRDPDGGIVGAFGPSPEANSTLVYAMLKSINSEDRCIILIQERELTHLMRHDNSIVIQRELGSDSTGMDTAITEGLNMLPHIIFAGDLRVTDRLPSLVRAVETQARVIVSVVATEKASFLHVFKEILGEQYAILGRRTRELVKVTPLANGGLTATLVDQTAADSTA